MPRPQQARHNRNDHECPQRDIDDAHHETARRPAPAERRIGCHRLPGGPRAADRDDAENLRREEEYHDAFGRGRQQSGDERAREPKPPRTSELTAPGAGPWALVAAGHVGRARSQRSNTRPDLPSTGRDGRARTPCRSPQTRPASNRSRTSHRHCLRRTPYPPRPFVHACQLPLGLHPSTVGDGAGTIMLRKKAPPMMALEPRTLEVIRGRPPPDGEVVGEVDGELVDAFDGAEHGLDPLGIAARWLASRPATQASTSSGTALRSTA
jgi:hypothetical protein